MDSKKVKMVAKWGAEIEWIARGIYTLSSREVVGRHREAPGAVCEEAPEKVISCAFSNIQNVFFLTSLTG